ncbi:MAG: phosphoribosyltransferase family protein [bacterium]|nr:phosphoribosyltransferase family protein [bacterium]
MRLAQLSFDSIEIDGTIIKALSHTTFELNELDSLANDIFEQYRDKINRNANKLGICDREANAYTYPIVCKGDKPTFIYFVVYSLETIGISVKSKSKDEADKLYRIFRELRSVNEDIEYIREHVKGTLDEIVASLLWQIGGIKVSLGDLSPLFRVDERLNYSPIYIDVKCLSRYPMYNDFIIGEAAALVGKLDFDMICSIEAGGIPFGTMIGDKTNKRSFFARREKRYPEASLLEIKENEIYKKKVLLVDDTIVKGWTKHRIIHEIRERGGIVNDCLVIFDRQQGGKETLSSVGVKLHYLTNRKAALSKAIPRSITYLTDKEYTKVVDYFTAPKRWHKNMNLPYQELKK